MPLTPTYGDGRVGPVMLLYLAGERALWRLIGQYLTDGRGLRRPWVTRQLLRIPAFRRGAARIVIGVATQAAVLIAALLLRAFRDGAAAARADLPGRPRVLAVESTAVEHAARVLEALKPLHDSLPNVAERVYRTVLDDVARAADPLSDADRDVIVRKALEREARRGFTGYVDPRGRRYEAIGWIEMLIRATCTHAEVDGYCEQLTAEGHDLFVVSDVPGACELCRPMEGHVISISGSTVGAITRESSTGRTVTVTVLCSLAEARKRGLFHRGCRHSIRVWTPDDPAPPRAIRATPAQRAARSNDRAAIRRRRSLDRIAAATR
jgi:hypothetical protein